MPPITPVKLSDIISAPIFWIPGFQCLKNMRVNFLLETSGGLAMPPITPGMLTDIPFAPIRMIPFHQSMKNMSV